MLGRILVVDDEEANRDMLSRRLVRRDYETIIAASAYEALAVLEDFEIDLVLLDIMMPGMSGLELLTVIRQKYSSSQLPVIMATAKADSSDVVEALSRGANDYVVKPIDIPVALARIERVLKETRTTAALERMNKDLLSKSSSSVGDATLDLSTEITNPAHEAKRKDRKRSGTPAVGSNLGKYKIRRKLGTGGSGTVYLAYDPLIEREVAIKVLSEENSDNNVHVQRFMAEAKATGQLGHPNIISVYDVNEHDGCLYIVMEYAEGGSLQTRIRKRGALEASEACRCIIEAASGLHAAHEHDLVHRDVKPDNLLLSSTNDVKVGDFGIVKYLASDSTDPALTQEGRRIGTPLFMSPEQITFGEIDCRTDIYALGGTFHYLLTGAPPFDEDTVAKVTAAHQNQPRPELCLPDSGFSELCTEAIAKAMAIDPDDRFATMTDFIRAVEVLRERALKTDETDIM